MGANVSKQISESVNDIYKERITNILSTNSVNASNFITANQDQLIKFTCGGDLNWNCDSSEWNQQIAANVKLLTSVTQTQANTISSLLDTDIENKDSKVMKMVFSVLSSIGEYKSQELSNQFINRVRNIVKESINTQNIVNIINRQKFNQRFELVVNAGGDCNFSGKRCQFIQNIVIDVIAENIINMTIDFISSDATINRILNDGKQDTQVEAKGLDDLIKSATSWMGGFGLLALGGAFVAFKYGTPSLPTATLSEVAKQKPYFAVFSIIFIIILIIFIIYIIIAAIFKIWPFSTKTMKLWICENKDGKNTGKCVEGQFEKGFKTKQECEQSNICGQFWGCDKPNGEFNGKCKEYTNATDGPKRTQKECEDAISNKELCNYKYGCAVDDNGMYLSPAVCKQYKDITLGKWNTENICKENSAQSCQNKWKCVSGKCSKASINSDWAMFDSEGDCKKLCKS